MTAPRSGPTIDRFNCEAATMVAAYFSESIDASASFFRDNDAEIANTCRLMAERFNRGGSLLVFGEGAQVSDAEHVAVEFVHPVIVGKRALPALALPSDASSLMTLGRSDDIALALCAGGPSMRIRATLGAALQRGMLTVLLSGGDLAEPPMTDLVFAVPHRNAMVVQEIHETLYHVLWELVHVFLDSYDDVASFLQSPAEEGRTARLSDQVRESTRQKSDTIVELRESVRSMQSTEIAKAASALAARVRQGGKVLAFGNGGSATDAHDAAADCMMPPIEGWRPIPALSLPNGIGVVTAVANDVGFDHVFTRQVIAFGGGNDIALGVTTSGTSRSVVNALREARSRGLLTIALTGYDGGALAAPGTVDYCFIARSDYVPRIQEAHATIWHALLTAVQHDLSSGARRG